jgi:hypothetical protein
MPRSFIIGKVYSGLDILWLFQLPILKHAMKAVTRILLNLMKMGEKREKRRKTLTLEGLMVINGKKSYRGKGYQCCIHIHKIQFSI